MMKTPSDHFSGVAKSYARYRPIYPSVLYQFILSKVERFELAWDVATGNGQVALALAPYFNHIIATDISKEQLDHAPFEENITYCVSRAEKTNIDPSSVDLITVGQAIHWFDIPNFLEEVKRVVKNKGILSFWGYGLFRVSPAFDQILDDFYHNIIGRFWPPERRFIDTGYSTISIDFHEYAAPGFEISSNWNWMDLEGYLGTWSAVQQFIANERYDPVPSLISELQNVHLPGTIEAKSPIVLRIGKFTKA